MLFLINSSSETMLKNPYPTPLDGGNPIPMYVDKDELGLGLI